MVKKTALSQFAVRFSDKKNKFEKSYTVDSQDESTAWQWVEKQRDEWDKFYKAGEDITDPKTWKVTVEQI